ncbi:MAG: hypothetical protein KGI99_02630 [Bradyrhizobium sp.]|uniref:hypothetical protein n=1 Tax=Bradyrhizobium sp. TaxID=376 RepID=UPI001C28A16E|nr:hypothetical protein [Bradyrhizobium sp.]MBU6461840.1 hypothetical protein [Pseudomonadota bacterium]MDE2066161.1 hypothetical protein [Bradyrhizobium sp.]
MTDALGKDPRDIWAAATAMHVVDGALSASERAGGPLPNADQIALLREIAKRALWHIPNSADEVRKLVRHVDIENLRQANSFDDDPPGG